MYDYDLLIYSHKVHNKTDLENDGSVRITLLHPDKQKSPARLDISKK